MNVLEYQTATRYLTWKGRSRTRKQEERLSLGIPQRKINTSSSQIGNAEAVERSHFKVKIPTFDREVPREIYKL